MTDMGTKYTEAPFAGSRSADEIEIHLESQFISRQGAPPAISGDDKFRKGPFSEFWMWTTKYSGQDRHGVLTRKG